MTALVIAVFDKSSEAESAIQNLTVARIPSAVVQRGNDDLILREDSNAIWPRTASGWQRPSVTVAVDEMHAELVTGILRQYGPVNIEERLAQSHRR